MRPFYCVAWRCWAVVVLFAAAGPMWPADQPQWGQRYTRNMVSEEKALPESFDPVSGKNIKWKADLGTETYSSPIIANGQVFIGTNNQRPRDPRHKGDRSVLLCLRETDGQLLWQLVVPKLTNSVYWDWPRAGICSPPTVEGNRIYLVSNRGEVLCLDAAGMANGNDGPYREEASHCVPLGAEPIEPSTNDADILWLFDIVQQCGVRQHDQAHCSILLDGDFLYINTSNGVDDSHRRIMAPDAPSLIVVEKSTGRLVAQDGEHIGPRIFHSTWSSPAMAEINGRRLIIFCGGDGLVYAFEPLQSVPLPGEVLTLKKVWQFDCDPEAPKENVHRFNSNRRISPSNIKSMPVVHEGRIYVTHGGDVWWGKNEAWLKCINPVGNGDITRTALVWSSPLDRHCMCTPAVQNGLVFISDSGGKIHCLDAQTGRTNWIQETRGEMWASPLVADGKVYVGTRRGDFWVLAARPEKHVFSTIEMGSGIDGTATAANGVLYIATMKYLYAVQATPAGAN